ncbi:MAG: cytochrome d ubiquinol oxidase subunit II [Bacteroidales bacterium]|nr:cytochrome d ubiquinol oxidase subunit II [Bacteroidales bacterium]
MFEALSYTILQQYWWAIVSLLAALLVFLLFVQGGQTLLYTIGKTDKERTMIINSLGRKWEFTFSTLVTFGGAFFASFPLFYATSFGGAYWVWMIILFAFIIQAVSYEYRTKANNFLGKKTYEIFLYINGTIAPILLGVAVSTFFTGSEFVINKMNLTNIGSNPAISYWTGPAHGLEAALNIQNLALGLAMFFLARVLALLYFFNTIDNKPIIERSTKCLKINAALFLVFFLFWLIRLLFLDGFAVNPETKEIFMEPYKYLHNLIQMPLVLIILLTGVVGVLWGIAKAILKKNSTNAIWFAGTGTILTVFALFLVAGFNNTAYYPAFPWDSTILENPEALKSFIQSSLTIENSSSSKYTLVAMSYVSIMIPFVFAYIFYAWRALNKKKITEEEMDNSSHKY